MYFFVPCLLRDSENEELRALAGPKEEVHNFWQFLQPQQFKTVTFTTGKKMSAIVLAHSAYLKPARALVVLA